jgi:ABC-2 type transport system ATP-binding protein
VFKKTTILDNVTFDINKGEIFGIIGISGSGKTTLLNTLIGFFEPDKGNILIYSEKEKKFVSVYKNLLETRKRFGFATQAASFYPELTVEENLIHFGILYGLSEKTTKINAKRLLDLVGLSNSKNVLAHNLSGGMEKKLGLACAFMHNPEVLILDEPTADLDVLSSVETWNLIKGINKLGTTVIVASHFLSEIESFCDRIAILYDKKIVTVGSPEEVMSKFFKSDEISIITSPGKYNNIASALRKKPSLDIRKIEQNESGLVLHTTQTEKTIYQALRIIDHYKEKLIRLDVKKPSLTKIFDSLKKE